MEFSHEDENKRIARGRASKKIESFLFSTSDMHVTIIVRSKVEQEFEISQKQKFAPICQF